MFKFKFFLILIGIFTSVNLYALTYEMALKFDEKAGKLFGEAVLTSNKPENISINTHSKSLKLINNFTNGKTVKLDKNDKLNFKFSYDLPSPVVFGGTKFFMADETWYPEVDNDNVKYMISITLPAGYTPVIESDETRKIDDKFFIKVPEHTDDLTFAVSNGWIAKEEEYKGIKISTLFTENNSSLSNKYIEKTKYFLDMYTKMLTPYPYKRFTIIDVPFPTGHALPSMTMLGSKIIKMPFITDISLGHEILHQWFGNLVKTRFDSGNWIEGLTTYLADHWYEELKGMGYLYRKNALLEYSAYVNSKNDFPLRDFSYRQDKASSAIGYGKSMMLFHMIRKEIGDDSFFSALKLFIERNKGNIAGWGDIRSAFNNVSGKKLDKLFEQFLYKKELPRFWPYGPEVSVEDGKYRLRFVVSQITGPFEFKLPVLIRSHRSSKMYFIDVKDKKQKVTLDIDEEPLELVFDSEYDLARIPTKPETYPSVSRLLGAESVIIVVSDNDAELYGTIRSYLKNNTIFKRPEDVTSKELHESSVIIAGKNNPLIKQFFDGKSLISNGFNLTTYKSPYDRMKIFAVLTADNKAELQAGLRKISHYGKYSKLGFNNGMIAHKEINSSTTGILKNVRNRHQVLKVSKTGSLEDMLDEIKYKKAVFVGEKHDEFSHHINQLEIIKGLHSRGLDIAVGFEMFQRPFQIYLDKYINGEITEKEMLEKTEYFKRWGFNYHLYKPIVDFLKANRIPAVALNLEEEITKKINKSGIQSLSPEDKNKLPKELDYSDEKHLVSTLKAFRMTSAHGHKKMVFNNFYEAMLAWDETMAETAADYLLKHPEKTIVVIAGSGHLAHKRGIPKRFERRTGFASTVIVNDDNFEDGIADYILFPDIAEGKTPLTLGIYLGDGLKIEKVIEDYPAMKAEIKEGDVIISINKRKVKDISELKAELFFINKGDKITVEIMRDDKIVLKNVEF